MDGDKKYMALKTYSKGNAEYVLKTSDFFD